MSSLPAGLTLYIFVSTIFGVTTQALIFKKGSTNKPVVVS
jgi:membrane protein insertase Oxa1/YidC/SpoIIIJ